MIGRTHGIGILIKISLKFILKLYNLDQELMRVEIVVHQVVLEDRPIHHHRDHLQGKNISFECIVIITLLFFDLVHLDRLIHVRIQLLHQVDQGKF